MAVGWGSSCRCSLCVLCVFYVCSLCVLCVFSVCSLCVLCVFSVKCVVSILYRMCFLWFLQWQLLQARCHVRVREHVLQKTHSICSTHIHTSRSTYEAVCYGSAQYGTHACSPPPPPPLLHSHTHCSTALTPALLLLLLLLYNL
jgi:hypothetical protein